MTPADRLSAWDVAILQERVRDLEQKLSDVTSKHDTSSSQAPTPAPIITAESALAGTFHIVRDSGSVMHKTRLFGQSHWSNGVALVRYPLYDGV